MLLCQKVSGSWELKAIETELSVNFTSINKKGVPSAESSHALCGLGKGISRQSFPCFIIIMQGG